MKYLLTQGVYVWLVGRRVSIAESVYFQLHVFNSIFSVSLLTYTRCDRKKGEAKEIEGPLLAGYTAPQHNNRSRMVCQLREISDACVLCRTFQCMLMHSKGCLLITFPCGVS